MNVAWTQHLSDLLKKELERLQNGNAVQKKRFNLVFRAITRVLQNPEHSEYVKTDLAGHCAVDIGDQYRLFFYIEHEFHVVHFVWLNDEEFIHTTRGFKDHCYEQFKKLIHDGEIKRYVHEEPEVPNYEKDGEFGVQDYIYFKAMLGEGIAQSAANLGIDEDPLIEMHVKKDEYVYSIQYLDAKDFELRKLLLLWICGLASEASVNLSYYLPLSKINYAEFKGILLECGFEVIHSEKEEIYLKRY